MKSFLSQNKYRILTILVMVASLLVVGFLFVPKAKDVGESLVVIRSQLENSDSVQKDYQSLDSLTKEYLVFSQKIEKITHLQVSSSKILTFVHNLAEKTNVSLQDLSTEEVVLLKEMFEIPVSFKAKASFKNFHMFLTEIENGDFCIGINNVNMKRDNDGSIVAFVKLSVVSKGSTNE